MTDYVLFRDLAAECGYHANTKLFHAKLRRKGLLSHCIKVGDPNPNRKHGNKILAVPLHNIAEIKSRCSRETTVAEQPDLSSPGCGEGWFYAVQTIPAYKPERVKLGFGGRSGMNSVEDRLSDYKTVLGNEMTLLAKYPCNEKWEKAAIHAFTRANCHRVEGARELFDFGCLNTLKAQMNHFFIDVMGADAI